MSIAIITTGSENFCRLSDDLKDAFFDREELQKIAARIVAVYGRETLREVLDHAIGQLGIEAGLADAQLDALRALAEAKFPDGPPDDRR